MISKQMVLIMAGLMIICGCAAAPASSAGKPGEERLLAQNTRTSRLIIKFRNSSPDATKPEVAESLSATAGVRLVYVRPVSGGSHVFCLENAAGSAALAEVIMKLSTRPDIMYVEEDRIMRHHLDR